MGAKSAARKNTFVDSDDAPELTDDWFEHTDLMQGEKLVRRGRPAGMVERAPAETVLILDSTAELR